VKFVLLVLAIALLLWMLFGRSRTRRSTRQDAPASAERAPEEMVACAHCGVHLPRSEALHSGRLAYCSAAHRDAGPRADAR
jgi:uncharacterized protein